MCGHTYVVTLVEIPACRKLSGIKVDLVALVVAWIDQNHQAGVYVQSGKTPADDLRKALEHVPSEKLLGVVLNRQKTSSKRYGYGYYYR